MLRNIANLTVANIIAQALQLVAQVWLVRLYTPSEFGLLAQVLSISAILAVIVSMQLNTCVITAKTKHETAEITAYGYTLVICNSIGTLLLIPVTYPFIGTTDTDITTMLITWLIIACVSIGNLSKGVATAQNNFSHLRVFTVVRASCLIGAQTLLGLTGINKGLIVGLAIAELSAAALITLQTPCKRTPPQLRGFKSKLKQIFHKHQKILIYGTAQELIAVTTFMLPLYLIPRVYGLDTGGQFALAHRITWAPISLLTQAASPVFLKVFSNALPKNLAESKLLNIRITVALGIVALPICLYVVEPLFSLLFGSRWAAAGGISKWLSLWCLAFLLSLPYRVVLRAIKKQPMQLIIDTTTLCANIMIFAYASTYQKAVLLITSVGIIQNLVMIVVARHYISNE